MFPFVKAALAMVSFHNRHPHWEGHWLLPLPWKLALHFLVPRKLVLREDAKHILVEQLPGESLCTPKEATMPTKTPQCSVPVSVGPNDPNQWMHSPQNTHR